MAAAPAPSFEDIRKSLKKGDIAPVYILHGEEGYFIDELAREFENILPEADREFNQYVLYAPETEPESVMNLCRRIPMMADRQVVVLKEAQAIRADKIAKLKTYIAEPVATTVLVVCARGAALKGKELFDAAKKGGAVVFESKKIAEWNIAAYIGAYIRQKGLNADQKALDMLRDFVGTDLSRLYNEVDKLATLLPPNASITPEAIERNIGVSREYNTFELVDAIAARDPQKVFRIMAYFRSNPKAVPLVMAVASIFNFFTDLLVAYYTPDKSDSGLSAALGCKPFALKRIKLGMSRYNALQIVEIIGAIRDFDVKSKGVGSRQNEHQLFQELAYHILSAPGRV